MNKLEMASMDIDKYLVDLRAAGATGLDQCETRLRNNARNVEKLRNLFYEGLAALMFLRHCWRVMLRESPDLQIELGGQVAYAEVKHFRQKNQDKLNEQAMLNARGGILALLDEPTATEGNSAWEQIADVAIKKASQYVEGAANILVVESDSECLELTVTSAVHEYVKRVPASADSPLRRLSGILLVTRGSMSFKERPSNVEFCQTKHAAVPLNDRLAGGLNSIRIG